MTPRRASALDTGVGEVIGLTPGEGDAVNCAAIVPPRVNERLEQGCLARPSNADGEADPAAGAQLVNDLALRLAVLGRKVQIWKCQHRRRDVRGGKGGDPSMTARRSNCLPSSGMAA
jgi:hypothetical protein